MSGVRGVTVGRTIPDCYIAQHVGEEVRVKLAREALGGQHVIVVGAPAAFAPPAASQQVLSLIANADQLRAGGYDGVYCLVATDPFATRAWAERIDPEGKVTFWSDGNLEFARAFGLVALETRLVLGERSSRYLMTLRRSRVESLRVEHAVVDYACVRPETHMLQQA